MSSAGVSLDQLFHLHRFQKTIDYFPLFFYFPFGISLAVVRFFIGCHAFLAACILPKSSAFRRFVLRSISFVLGIVVRQENCHYRAKQVKVIISNHITTLDHLAVDLVLSSILPSVWDLPNLLNWLLGFKDLGVKKGRDVLLQNVKKHTKESDKLPSNCLSDQWVVNKCGTNFAETFLLTSSCDKIHGIELHEVPDKLKIRTLDGCPELGFKRHFSSLKAGKPLINPWFTHGILFVSMLNHFNHFQSTFPLTGKEISQQRIAL
ncbi:ancient ubiquitous protein 1 homolog [Centruroides sculpturatus]|uniref:ancient ubiquitous protein 1 homolog n=1 Tax=Centruroides sculpturatus TaxID=218467 RepID=UPI000C6D446F|nr:ancient ubiquitous protein 1 homolog [Centruroides sculpturatus]